MPYAVISDRGRQYTVKAGERLRVDFREGAPGDRVVFDRVLLYRGDGDAEGVAGSPAVAGVIVRHGRAKKIVVYKIKRRKGYRRKQGHRQDFTEVRIDAVHGS